MKVRGLGFIFLPSASLLIHFLPFFELFQVAFDLLTVKDVCLVYRIFHPRASFVMSRYTAYLFSSEIINAYTFSLLSRGLRRIFFDLFVFIRMYRKFCDVVRMGINRKVGKGVVLRRVCLFIRDDNFCG